MTAYKPNTVCNPPESIYCGREDCLTCQGKFWEKDKLVRLPAADTATPPEPDGYWTFTDATAHHDEEFPSHDFTEIRPGEHPHCTRCHVPQGSSEASWVGGRCTKRTFLTIPADRIRKLVASDTATRPDHPQEDRTGRRIAAHLHTVKNSPDWADLAEILSWYREDVGVLLAERRGLQERIAFTSDYETLKLAATRPDPHPKDGE